MDCTLIWIEQMAESNAGTGRSCKKLIFASGNPMFNSVGSLGLLVGSAILVVAIYGLAAASSTTSLLPENAGTFVAFLFFACIVYQLVTRQWIAEIDLTTRRLKIFRRSFGRWTKVIADCSLDECIAFGTIEYETDGHISYGAYVQLTHGRRHAIPLTNSGFDEAARVASQLSAATGIQRLDTRF
jgi:hypothetical protein